MVPGTVLGSYQVVSLLGAGGMGEVYRARDTKLGRDVALKVLPAALSDDAERVARFQREAQLLASLNHPNIGAIYGLEQSPSARFLVLELLEGGTLARRVERGPLPLDEATDIARQIALALQAAHDKGVVHRDLKPSNVAFTAAGDVKVLDFGLAKLGDAGEQPITSATLSPTITSPALMTGVGTLLGTAAYMAPEQAKGKPADKRSDVWAFGCVLYEMLAGARAFEGDDIADTLANVLKVEPEWSRLPPALPPAISVLLRRCLAKDPRQRSGDIAAALILLEESAHLTPAMATSPTAPRAPGPARRFGVPAAVTVIVATAVAAATWWAMRPAPPAVVRTSIVLAASSTPSSSEIAITPDGTRVVFVGNNQTQILVRALQDLEPKLLVSGSSIRGLFVSPDSQSVVYTDGNLLMRAALTGGPANTIAQVDAPARGVTWLDDESIVFATAAPTTGLQRVAATGGDVTVLTRPDPKQGEGDHIAPTRLPGGRGVLFTVTSNSGAVPQIAAIDLVTGERTFIVRGTQARYVASGHLVYVTDGVLQAVPFDLGTKTMKGAPVPVLERFRSIGGVIPVLDVAANGTLVYAPGSTGARVPVWVDRDGRETAIKGPTTMYQTPRLSPNGQRLAYHDITSSGEYDVWILNLERGTADRLTTERGRDSEPIWSPDSGRIAYHSAAQPGGPGIFVRRADGAGTVERVTTGVHLPISWSADGKWLAYADFGDRGISIATVVGLMKVEIDGEHTPQMLLKGSNGRLSPTERWVAVTSATTGLDEIYVVPFPDTAGARTRISTDGGQNATWSPDGKTLYYRRGQAIMTVSVTGDDPATWPKPTMLFEGPYVFDVGPTHYDAAQDGRLLMVKGVAAEGDGAPSQYIVVQNWFEELRRLAPPK
jgi:eukaryotic-like serine/threonine-protein kinase